METTFGKVHWIDTLIAEIDQFENIIDCLNQTGTLPREIETVKIVVRAITNCSHLIVRNVRKFKDQHHLDHLGESQEFTEDGHNAHHFKLLVSLNLLSSKINILSQKIDLSFSGIQDDTDLRLMN